MVGCNCHLCIIENISFEEEKEQQQLEMGDSVADKSVFSARYEFMKAIGNGGQAAVFKYKDKSTGESVVVKEYGHLSSREWRMLASVNHPHICGLVDRVRYENRAVCCTKIVMEAMDMTLQTYMQKGEKRKRLDPSKDFLDLQLAKEIFYAILLGIDYLHHKLIVHLDVKLENILLKLNESGEIAREDELFAHSGSQLNGEESGREDLGTACHKRKRKPSRYCVKLADFGLAMLLGGDPAANKAKEIEDVDGIQLSRFLNKRGGLEQPREKEEEEEEERADMSEASVSSSSCSDNEQPTSSSASKYFSGGGTYNYMAPEVQKDSRFGVQADIYSLGVVLHLMLTAKYPQLNASLPGGIEIDASIPDVDGLRGLLTSMLHQDPYQRPHSFHILEHSFLSSLREEGDTLLGDYLDECEQAVNGRVLLLQVLRGKTPPSLSGRPDDEKGAAAAAPSYLPTTTPHRPLNVYVAYMDLAEVKDEQAAVVVCGRTSSITLVRKGEASTLGAILGREGVGAETSFGDVFELIEEGEKTTAMWGATDEEEEEENRGGGEGARSRHNSACSSYSAGTSSSTSSGGMDMMDIQEEEEEEKEEEGGEERRRRPVVSFRQRRRRRMSLAQVRRKSGAEFDYVRSLWVALANDDDEDLFDEEEEEEQDMMTGEAQGLLDKERSKKKKEKGRRSRNRRRRRKLSREDIWSIYEELRRWGATLSEGEGTSIYLPMTACDDRVQGFRSPRAQRQAIIQESVGLAQFYAAAASAGGGQHATTHEIKSSSSHIVPTVENIILYTWQKDSIRICLDFVRAFREDFHGCLSARLDEEEYLAYIRMLQGVILQEKTQEEAAATEGIMERLIEMEKLNTYPAVCCACWELGQFLEKQYGSRLLREEKLKSTNGLLDVLQYNVDKVRYEEKRQQKEKEEGGEKWLPMVGHYDALRSLHATLSLLRLLLT